MSTFDVPIAKNLRKRFEKLDGLLTATEWERAALVWVFTTRDDPGGRPASNKPAEYSAGFPKSYSAFAREEFKGLTDRNMVSFYGEKYEQARKDGHVPTITEGEKGVHTPDIEWEGRPKDKAANRKRSANPKRKDKNGVDLSEYPTKAKMSVLHDWLEADEDFREGAKYELLGHEPIPQEYLDQDIADMISQIDVTPIRFIRKRIKDLHVFQSGQEAHELQNAVADIIREWENVQRTITNKISDTNAANHNPDDIHIEGRIYPPECAQ